MMQAFPVERVLAYNYQGVSFFSTFIYIYHIYNSFIFKKEQQPVHSLLLVKSIPRIKFEDSRPASLRAETT